MSDKRISISLDEYNMLHSETLAQKDTITRLTAEVERLTGERDRQYDYNVEQIAKQAALEAENEKLRAALRECEAELNAYYRMKYPGDHPHSQKELAKAMASNPATVALKENNNDQA
jgi:hypothetical protein